MLTGRRSAIGIAFLVGILQIALMGCSKSIKYYSAYNPNDYKIAAVIIPSGPQRELLDRLFDQIEEAPFKVVWFQEKSLRNLPGIAAILDSTHRITPELAAQIAKSCNATLVIYQEPQLPISKSHRPQRTQRSESGSTPNNFDSDAPPPDDSETDQPPDGKGEKPQGMGGGHPGDFSGGQPGGMGGPGGMGPGGQGGSRDGKRGMPGRGPGGMDRKNHPRSDDRPIRFNVIDVTNGSMIWQQTIEDASSNSEIKKFAKHLVTAGKP